MIAVIGAVGFERPGAVRDSGSRDGRACGQAVEIARAIAARGRKPEIVTKLGTDEAGDAAVVSLGLQGIGHAAVLRDASARTPLDLEPDATLDDEAAESEPPGRPLPEGPLLERADVELALRYLPEIGVVVVVDGLTPDALAAAVEGAAFAGARLVVLSPGDAVPPAVPDDATVLEAPDADEGPFARFVADYACLLDEKKRPDEALGQALANSGWEPVSA